MNYLIKNRTTNEMLAIKTASKILDVIIIWSLITSLIVLLPIVRIIGKPTEYYWSLLGYKGEGATGPYWIFIAGLILAITMFFSVYRSKNRIIAYVLLLLWQVSFTGIILVELINHGLGSTIQGQGWNWEFPIWIIGIPALLILITTVYWVYLEYKHKLEFAFKQWSKKNTVLLITAIVLLILATMIFHLGDNYNWVTALAISITITQWVIMIESFKPYNKSNGLFF